MTLEQLKQGWMRVATDHARRRPISPCFGRPRTDAKVFRKEGKSMGDRVPVMLDIFTEEGL